MRTGELGQVYGPNESDVVKLQAEIDRLTKELEFRNAVRVSQAKMITDLKAEIKLKDELLVTEAQDTGQMYGPNESDVVKLQAQIARLHQRHEALCERYDALDLRHEDALKLIAELADALLDCVTKIPDMMSSRNLSEYGDLLQRAREATKDE